MVYHMIAISPHSEQYERSTIAECIT